jgi:hypothetical protein
MQTAIEHYGLPLEAMETMEAVAEWRGRLPDRGPRRDDGGHLWSCHGIARAAKGALALDERWRVVDGVFMRVSQEHAWLEFSGDGRRLILDVLPVACLGGPILVDMESHGSPWPSAYVEQRLRYEDRFAAFDAEAREIVAADGRHMLAEIRAMAQGAST